MEATSPCAQPSAVRLRTGQAVRPRVLGLVSADERRLFLAGATELLQSILPLADVLWPDGSEGVEALLHERNPDVVLTGWSTPPLRLEWLEGPACALRYACHLTGSVRRLVPRVFIERGGLVSNWGEIPATTVAEHALLLALAALRNQPRWSAAEGCAHNTVRRVETLSTRSLFGCRVGIHGFGSVARALVPLLRPFGVDLAVFSAGVPDSLVRAAGLRPAASLASLFAHSQVLFECEALTPASAGMVSGDVLAALPDGAVFVNVARGLLVDEAALLREAGSGRLRVALDVMSADSLECRRARFAAAGAMLSPHIAGPTLDQYADCGRFALRNIIRFLRREPVEGVVTLERYDRST